MSRSVKKKIFSANWFRFLFEQMLLISFEIFPVPSKISICIFDKETKKKKTKTKIRLKQKLFGPLQERTTSKFLCGPRANKHLEYFKINSTKV